MKPSKALMTLGLASRAGAVVSGEMMTEKAIRSGKAFLLILADDASEQTKKRFNDHAAYYNVPVLTVESREILGHAIGKEFRAMAAVTDEKLALLIVKQSGPDA